MHSMTQHIYFSNQKAQLLTTDALYSQNTSSWPNEYIRKKKKQTAQAV